MTAPIPGRPVMPEGYGVPGTDEGILDWSWATERLEPALTYWFSTTRPDGRPHAMPAWGVWLDDALYFEGSPATRRARNLADNPELVVHLESGDETVILEGLAEPVLDAEVERGVDEAYGAKYDFTPDSSGEADPWFAVHPRRAYVWTESGYPGSATQFDFD